MVAEIILLLRNLQNKRSLGDRQSYYSMESSEGKNKVYYVYKKKLSVSLLLFSWP